MNIQVLNYAFSHFYNSSGKHGHQYEKSCRTGDVRLKADGTPEFFLRKQFYPICGHYFWNNQHGAKSFCKKLGYLYGEFQRKLGQKYDVDAVLLGACYQEEALESCSAGCNNREVGNTNCGNCKSGENVKITIRCDGHAEGLEVSSCEGINLFNRCNLWVYDKSKFNSKFLFGT